MSAKILEYSVKDSYIRKIVEIEKRHIAKYGRRNMSKKELDELFGKAAGSKK